MKHKHISLLNEQAEHFFDMAKRADKPKDKISFTQWGQDLMRDAREILASNHQNSILIYFEFMLNVKLKPDYASYLEFATRNGLDLLAEVDYNALTSSIQKEMISE